MSRRTPDEISRAFSALSMRLGARDNKAAKARVKTLSDEDLEDLTSYVHRHAGRREWAVVSSELRRRGLRKNPNDSSVRSPTRTSTEVRSPTSTSTEVRSPTSTSTEVRSPTSTSTDAYTSGNITVTGGAGAGATTSVTVLPRSSQRGAAKQEHAEWRSGRNGVRRVTESPDETPTFRERLGQRMSGMAQDDDDVPPFRKRLGQKMAGHAGRTVYANPDLDTARAAEVFEMWHKKQPKQAGVMRLGVDGNDAMVCIGNANDIVYRSGKWEKGRKTNDYCHTFDSKPKVWMLQHIVEPGLKRNGAHGEKTVESLLRKTKNADGQFAVADLAAPISLSVDGEDGPEELTIHTGSRVYGAIDQRTVIIVDPHWKLIVIKGGEMHFDERGIVK